jgi:hypothetical protein
LASMIDFLDQSPRSSHCLLHMIQGILRAHILIKSISVRRDVQSAPFVWRGSREGRCCTVSRHERAGESQKTGEDIYCRSRLSKNVRTLTEHAANVKPLRLRCRASVQPTSPELPLVRRVYAKGAEVRGVWGLIPVSPASSALSTLLLGLDQGRLGVNPTSDII